MSIYNRSYMRAGRPEDMRRPWALRSILVTLVAVFLLQNILRHWLGSVFLEATFALELAHFVRGWLYTIVTYGLLHSTDGALPWHLVFNGLMLHWFGREIEERIGSERFFECFFFCIVMGGAVWLAVQYLGGRNHFVVGASSGVFGILYLYCRHLWHQQMGFLFIPLRFTGAQLFYVILGFQLFFFLFAELPGNGSATAHSAHLGGILGAYLYERHLLARRSLIGLLRSLMPGTSVLPPAHSQRSSASARAVPPRSYSVNVASAPSPGELKREVDRILDKINEKGFGALTTEEKQTLDRAKDLL